MYVFILLSSFSGFGGEPPSLLSLRTYDNNTVTKYH
jgi:hypothetical protein